jgi:uncharacterized protein Yka (UPF0111/DUF47 family)
VPGRRGHRGSDAAAERRRQARRLHLRGQALEDEADAIHHDLLGTLLAPRGDLAPADVLRIITLKEVVDTLEDAADAFETVANTVESIAVKES